MKSVVRNPCCTPRIRHARNDPRDFVPLPLFQREEEKKCSLNNVNLNSPFEKEFYQSVELWLEFFKV